MKKDVSNNYNLVYPLSGSTIKTEPKVKIQVWQDEDYFFITLNGKEFANTLFEDEVEEYLEHLFSYINGCVDIKNGEDLFNLFD